MSEAYIIGIVVAVESLLLWAALLIFITHWLCKKQDAKIAKDVELRNLKYDVERLQSKLEAANERTERLVKYEREHTDLVEKRLAAVQTKQQEVLRMLNVRVKALESE